LVHSEGIKLTPGLQEDARPVSGRQKKRAEPRRFQTSIIQTSIMPYKSLICLLRQDYIHFAGGGEERESESEREPGRRKGERIGGRTGKKEPVWTADIKDVMVM